MIELAQRFVPAADETWRLQRGDDDECRFFQSFADQAHYRGAGGSRQGIYVVTPAGELLASGNILDPESEVSQILENNRVFVLNEEVGTIPRFFYYFDERYPGLDQPGESGA